MIGIVASIGSILSILSSESVSALCHEFKVLPVETPIIERFKDSLGSITKKVPPQWGEPWYLFRFSTNDRNIEISGAVILRSNPDDIELLYNGVYYIETEKFDCGCEIIKKKRICHEWKEKKILRRKK